MHRSTKKIFPCLADGGKGGLKQLLDPYPPTPRTKDEGNFMECIDPLFKKILFQGVGGGSKTTFSPPPTHPRGG